MDAVVCGVGSGGTITGLTRFFRPGLARDRNRAGRPERLGADALRQTGELIEAGSWAVEGIGEDFIPPIVDLSGVRAAYTISDEESFEVARALLTREGTLAGSSSGTLVAAALRYCREQTRPKARRHLHLRQRQQVSFEGVQ